MFAGLQCSTTEDEYDMCETYFSMYVWSSSDKQKNGQKVIIIDGAGALGPRIIRTEFGTLGAWNWCFEL